MEMHHYKDDCIEVIGIVLKWGLSLLYGVFTLTKTESDTKTEK